MNEWHRRYRLCLKFAGLFNSEFTYDITHDAWEYYLTKTKTDLFAISLKDEASYLFTVMKKAFYRWYYKERKGPKYIYSSVDDLSTGGDIADNVDYRMRVEALRKALIDKAHRPAVARTIFDSLLAAEGDQTLAAKNLDISKQQVNFYVKQLRTL